MKFRSLADEAAQLSRESSNVALCLDFDGTLAPVVDDPECARPLPGLVDLLGRLARRFAAVALVSGRPAAYLAKHAPAPAVRYLGLYGLQEIRDGRLWVDPRLVAAKSRVDAAAEDLRVAPAVVESGAHLEDKEYAIAVHTRRVADPARWAQAIDGEVCDIALRHGLEVIPGRLVWELRPAVRGDKGDAVARVVDESGARSVVVIGDDLGDVPAFAAATRFAAAGNAALRIAVHSAEMPAPLLDHVDQIVEGPTGVRDFLESLVPEHSTTH